MLLYMKLKYLARNRVGTFIYRRYVPPHLVNAVGVAILSKTLDTRDPEIAAKRHERAHAWAEAMLARAKRAAASASHGDIEYAANQFLRRELDLIEAGAPPLDPKGSPLPLDFGNPAWRAAKVEDAMRQTGIAVRQGTKRWQELKKALEDALDESIIAESIRSGGLPLPPDIVERAGQGPTVAFAIEKWIEKREQRIGLKGAREARHSASLFGNQRLLSEIRKADAVKFRDDMIEAGRALDTVKKYIMYLRGAFDDYCQPLDPAPRNPFAGLKYIKVARPREVRREFSAEILESLFQQKIFTAPKNTVNGQVSFWATLIALFTGARQAEIIQLNRDDITTVKKISVIEFHGGRGEETKSIKNEESIRRVPVPQALIDIGFLKYVEGQKGRLFRIEADSHGNPAGLFSKRINRIIRKVETDPTVNFHSLRHTFIQWAAESEMRDDYLKAIVGHEDGSTTNTSYNKRKGISQAALKREMDKIVFPVDIKLLKGAAVKLQP